MNAISPRIRARGFSLVELMAGIVVGLIGLLVIYRTLAVWEIHTRTTTAGGDAQVAGTLAMFNLERDIKLAGMGFGLAPAPVMGCVVTGTDSATARALNFPLFPVQIASAASSPDSINVLAGNSSFFVSSEKFNFSTAASKKMERRHGFRKGDVVIVAGNDTGAPGSSDCRLVQITDNTDLDGFTLSHATGSFTPDAAYLPASGASAVTSRFNDAAGTGTIFTAGTMYNLGPAPVLSQWQVSASGVLTRGDFLHGTSALDVSQGVVNLKAQYGIDANADNKIDETEWVTTTPTDWTKVRAIRVAMLVRSSQFEKPPADGASAIPVTPAAPAWSAGTFVMMNVDGTPDSETAAVPNNWRYYRYQVYEKVIPLRNMVWGTSP